MREPNIALGIALQTFYDEDEITKPKEERLARLEAFPKSWIPFAETIVEDFRMAGSFVKAIAQGLKTLKPEQLSDADKQIWLKAEEYIDARPF